MRIYCRVAFFFVVLGVLGACKPGADDGRPPGWEREQKRRIEALGNQFGIRVSNNAASDIQVRQTEDGVRVRFSDQVIERVGNDCLNFLEFDGPEKTMSEEDYHLFLEDLGGYLLMNPIREEEDEK